MHSFSLRRRRRGSRSRRCSRPTRLSSSASPSWPSWSGPWGTRAEGHEAPGVKWVDTILGRTKPKAANLDALFAVPGPAITLEAAMGLKSAGAAAVCFKPASAYEFASTCNDIGELLELSGKDTGSTVSQSEDSYGYHWIVVHDDDMSDVVTTVHMVNSSLAERGYENQLLASVFAFRDE